MRIEIGIKRNDNAHRRALSSEKIEMSVSRNSINKARLRIPVILVIALLGAMTFSMAVPQNDVHAYAACCPCPVGTKGPTAADIQSFIQAVKPSCGGGGGGGSSGAYVVQTNSGRQTAFNTNSWTVSFTGGVNIGDYIVAVETESVLNPGAFGISDSLGNTNWSQWPPSAPYCVGTQPSESCFEVFYIQSSYGGTDTVTFYASAVQNTGQGLPYEWGFILDLTGVNTGLASYSATYTPGPSGATKTPTVPSFSPPIGAAVIAAIAILPPPVSLTPGTGFVATSHYSASWLGAVEYYPGTWPSGDTSAPWNANVPVQYAEVALAFA